MRVLVISHTYIVRANHPKLHEIASLPDVKLRVIVPQTWSEGLHGSLPVQLPQNPNFDFVPLPTVLTGRGSRYMHRSLTLTMRKFRPDIIYVEEGWRGLTMFQAALYKRLWAPHARLVFFTWENIFRPVPKWQRFVPRYNLRHIAHGVCGNEDGVAVARAGGYRGPLSVVAQLGVDTTAFFPQPNPELRDKLGIGAETFVIGFAARMVPEKGSTLLIEAAARAELKSDWKLLLIGSGDERERALERAKELNVEKRLVIVDTVPHLELAKYYNIMDVLVSPSVTTSTWKEQFGLVVAQAMSCGIPVIGSTCGETPNLIGDAGLIFQEGDVEALSKHLSCVQSDTSLRDDLKLRGIERMQTHYSFPSIARRTHKIWQEVLNA